MRPEDRRASERGLRGAAEASLATMSSVSDVVTRQTGRRVGTIA